MMTLQEINELVMKAHDAILDVEDAMGQADTTASPIADEVNLDQTGRSVSACNRTDRSEMGRRT